MNVVCSVRTIEVNHWVHWFLHIAVFNQRVLIWINQSKRLNQLNFFLKSKWWKPKILKVTVACWQEIQLNAVWNFDIFSVYIPTLSFYYYMFFWLHKETEWNCYTVFLIFIYVPHNQLELISLVYFPFWFRRKWIIDTTQTHVCAVFFTKVSTFYLNLKPKMFSHVTWIPLIAV